MKIFKTLLKVFLILALVVALAMGGIALYMKYYGKGILEDVLSNMLGSRVRFESISVNMDKYGLSFGEFSILSEIGFDENVFDAEKFTLRLNKESLDRDKKVLVEEIFVKKGVLNIVRNRTGAFNVSFNGSGEPFLLGSVAYAAETGNGLYNFAKNVKKVTIQDSVINFKDHHVPRGPFAITCDDFDLEIKSLGPPGHTGSIPMKCSINFEIPTNRRYGSSKFYLNADIAARRYGADIDVNMETKYIDLMQFLPYFESYTPFSFNDGVFSSTTSFKVQDGFVDSLTTMVFHRLKLLIDPGMENSRFLEASVNKLVPYLSSGSEVVFDFVIKGPVEKPRMGLGPRAKFAVGLVVVEEISNFIEQLQKLKEITGR